MPSERERGGEGVGTWNAGEWMSLGVVGVREEEGEERRDSPNEGVGE